MASSAPIWEWLLAAAFAPFVVWALWRLQTGSVHVLRRRMAKLLRNYGWLYNTVSWFGTLIHEMSHAIVLILTGHGVRKFQAGVDAGMVVPRRRNKGPVAFLSFLLAALAPLFIPAAAALAATYWLVDSHLIMWNSPGVGLAAAGEMLMQTMWTFTRRLTTAWVGLDLLDWRQAILVIFAVLSMPGGRPSHVKSRYHGEKDEGDIVVVRRKIRKHPVTFAVFLVLVYSSYILVVPRWPAFYWLPFQAIWATALTGVVLSLGGAVLWSLVAMTGTIRRWIAWLPLAVAVGVQWLGRQIDVPGALVTVNVATAVAFGAAALILDRVAHRVSVYDQF